MERSFQDVVLRSRALSRVRAGLGRAKRGGLSETTWLAAAFVPAATRRCGLLPLAVRFSRPLKKANEMSGISISVASTGAAENRHRR